MSPRIREQALPEKKDDRFFDRWVVDKARGLGARAVKRAVLVKLREVVRAFAEWRSLRHAPAAERESVPDREIVASAAETIHRAKTEAVRLDADAKEVERKAARRAAEAEEAEKAHAALPPALRGSKDWDVALTALANVVVLAVDIFIIHIALELVPGNDREHWITAITMGAGAVVVGDVLGWMAAAGAVRKDGTVGRPSRPVIIGVAGLLAVAVVFFVLLGEFRSDSLTAIGKHGPKYGDTTFFTIAQILFLLGAAVACFAYLARRYGRELLAAREKARKARDAHLAAAKSLREKAERARRIAASTPALLEQAKARIAARARIAAGEAKLDLKQGRYLEALIDPEYMRERADVESGVRYWQFESRSRLPRTAALRYAAIAAAALAAGGVAYWIAQHPIAPILVSTIIGLALLYAFGSGKDGSEENDEHARYQRYVARIVASVRTGDDRATDIESLVPFPGGSGDGEEEPGNGPGRSDLLTQEQWEKIRSSTVRFRDEE